MRKQLALLCLSFIVNGFMVILTGTLITYLISDCGLSYTQAGFITSIQSAGNLIAGLASGLIIRRIGRKKSALLFCLLFAGGFSVFLFSNSAALIYGMIFISGLGWGLCNNVCHLLVNQPSMKSNGIYFLHTSYALGAFIAPMVLHALLALTLGWRSSVWVVILSSLLLLLLFLPMEIPDELPVRSPSETGAAHPIDLSFFRNIRYYICFFLYFCYGGVETCINSWLITFLADRGIMSLSLAQFMLSMLWMVIIVGRLLQIWLEKRIHYRHLLTGQAVMMFTCITLLCFIRSEALAAALIFLIGLFMAGITPANALNAQEFMHGDGLSSGIIFAGSGLGSTVIPALVGTLFEKISLTAGMLSVSALLLLFSVMAIVNSRMVKKLIPSA